MTRVLVAVTFRVTSIMYIVTVDILILMIVMYTIKGVVVTYQHQHVEQSMDSDVIVSNTTYLTHTEYYIILITDPGECTDGEVRLADGVIEQEGRPEVCINGVWGSICQWSWSTTDGYVFCNSLGYDGPSMSCMLQTHNTL